MVFQHLFSFLATYSIFYYYQLGLRPQRSTTEAIVSIIEFITDVLKDLQLAAKIFLDFQKLLIHSTTLCFLANEANIVFDESRFHGSNVVFIDGLNMFLLMEQTPTTNTLNEQKRDS